MSVSEECHRLIGRLYELPVTNIHGTLPIVSMPNWMEAKDVDLMKAALKHYAAHQQETKP